MTRVSASGPRLSRRAALLAATATALPHAALAQNDELTQAILKWTGGVAPARQGVVFDVPKLVDNGNAVPVSVSVDSSMTPADHVVSIAIFNEKNPQREVAMFQLGPRAAKAQVATRIRLATSQKLAAIARMSDGSFRSHTVDVIVVLAACLEGDG